MEKQNKAFDGREIVDHMGTYKRGNKLKLCGEAEIQGRLPDKIFLR